MLLLAGLWLLASSIAITAVASAVSRQYRTTDSELKVGMAAAISADTDADEPTGAVERAGTTSATRTVGIVVAGDADITLSAGQTGSTVTVASSGQARAYVSDVNGTPDAGDLLAPSPIRGVLMRAVDGTAGIVGIALETFPEDTETVQLTTDDGRTTDARVGIVGVDLDAKTTTKSSGAASFLQRIGENITGRQVSNTQVLIAMGITVLVIVVVGAIAYGAITHYITSVGRNPLAKGALRRGLINITGLILAVLGVGLAAVYLVLWM